MAKNELKSKIANSLIFMGRGKRDNGLFASAASLLVSKTVGSRKLYLYVKQPSL